MTKGLICVVVMLCCVCSVHARFKQKSERTSPNAVLQEAQDHLLVLPDKTLEILATHQALLPVMDSELQAQWHQTKLIAAIRAAQLPSLYQTLNDLGSLSSTDYFQQHQSSIINGLGVWLRRSGYFEQAKASYLCGLELDTSSAQTLRSLINLGVVERNLGNFQQAKNIYLEAKELATELENSATLAALENNLGVLALSDNQWPQARQHFTHAMALNQQLDRRSGEMLSSLNLLLTFLYQQDYAYFARLHTRVERKLKLTPNSPRSAYFHVLMAIYQMKTQLDADNHLKQTLLRNFEGIQDTSIQSLIEPLIADLQISIPDSSLIAPTLYQGPLLDKYRMCDWQKYSTDPR